MTIAIALAAILILAVGGLWILIKLAAQQREDIVIHSSGDGREGPRVRKAGMGRLPAVPWLRGGRDGRPTARETPAAAPGPVRTGPVVGHGHHENHDQHDGGQEVHPAHHRVPHLHDSGHV